ncbi:MAG TPA: hypothetical protein VF928_13210 [Usitatibacteraceae bacterium]
MNTDNLSPDISARLDAQLDLLRRETETLAPGPHIAPALMTAFTAHQRKQRLRDWMTRWFAPGLGLAVSVGMAAWITLLPVHRATVDSAATGVDVAFNNPFIALQSLEQIALEPTPRLVETTMPRMMLAAYGVPVSPETANDSVHAQMLVSASGQPLALRFAQ